MYMHNIDSSKNTIIEDYVKDTDYIYNNRTTIDNASRYITHEEINDRSYTRSVFINTNIQEGVMCMDRSGMVTTVKYKPNINAKDIGNRISVIDRTNKSELTNGIYVVREWHIKTFRGMLAYCNMSLLDYYNNIEYYVKLPDSEMTLLKAKLQDMVGGVGKYNGTNDITIRSISFIPLNKLSEYKVIYDSHTDLVFSLGGIEKGLIHPNSVQAANLYDTHSENVKLDVNVLEIEMIDSHTRGKRYYTMLGNKVVALRSRTDRTKSDGATLNVTIGGYKNHEYTIPTDDLTSVGIYETADEAKSAGDLKNTLEMRKTALEYEKIEQQVIALEHEKFKMLKEKESVIKKYEHEIKMSNLKLESALFDYHKTISLTILDTKTKMLDLKLKQGNHLNTRIESLEKHQKEMSLLSYKTKVEKDKANAKTLTTVLDTVIKYGSALIK